MDDQNKNLLLATALSFLVIVMWFVLFPPPSPEKDGAGNSATQSSQLAPPTDGTTAKSATGETASPPTGAEPVAGKSTIAATAPQPAPDTAARIAIDTPKLVGSVSLRGGRIDQLALKGYHETIDPNSDLVTLLSPVGSDTPYYALFGWAAGGGLSPEEVPGANTIWTVEQGDTLTPQTPVTLVWDNGAGLIFRRQISVDEQQMFTITQAVQNTASTTQTLAPYGIIARHGLPDTLKKIFIIHEGAIRRVDGELTETKYSKMPPVSDFKPVTVTQEAWTGFTDQYWMTALVPDKGQDAQISAFHDTGRDIYQTTLKQPTVTVEPGASFTTSTRLFTGAKEWETLKFYQDKANVPGLTDAIDWGWFFFLTKPIFIVLHWLHVTLKSLGVPGAMGWAIIGLTIVIKALLFPLAFKSYVSMAKMKELQPRMQELKEQAGDDRQKLQQEMMALYKKEKVNPASGCLPILLQVPIFFSLYKMIRVTLELRHAPWIGWINDLSAPDPSSLYNFFGLLPWDAPDPHSTLAHVFIGLLPLLLGISMWLQQKLNPAPTDPTQQMIFAWMPWVFMFMLGNFASGLVLYWITNNTLTFTQQYTIMRLQGYKPDVFGNIKSSFRRKKQAAKK